MDRLPRRTKHARLTILECCQQLGRFVPKHWRTTTVPSKSQTRTDDEHPDHRRRIDRGPTDLRALRRKREMHNDKSRTPAVHLGGGGIADE
jgi:hypothetical protein